MVRLIGGGLVVAFIVAAVLAVNQCKDSFREEGRQEVTTIIQQESLGRLLHEREVTSHVLMEREERRGINDKTSTQAQKKIYEAKETEHSLDAPLPDSITRPLLMQYEAITAHSQGGEVTTASRVDGRAGNTRTAKGVNLKDAGTLDK